MNSKPKSESMIQILFTGKSGIAKFLSDEAGKKIRLKEGDGVDIIVASDDVKA